MRITPYFGVTTVTSDSRLIWCELHTFWFTVHFIVQAHHPCSYSVWFQLPLAHNLTACEIYSPYHTLAHVTSIIYKIFI